MQRLLLTGLLLVALAGAAQTNYIYGPVNILGDILQHGQPLELGGQYVTAANPPLEVQAGTISLTNDALLGIVSNRLFGISVSNVSDRLHIYTNFGVSGQFTLSQSLYANGSVYANSFFGSGSGLSGLNAGALASGTVPQARLGTNAAQAADGMFLRKSGDQTQWGADGWGLTNLNAAALAAGTVPAARLGTNANQSATGMILVKSGDQTRWSYDAASLTNLSEAAFSAFPVLSNLVENVSSGGPGEFALGDLVVSGDGFSAIRMDGSFTDGWVSGLSSLALGAEWDQTNVLITYNGIWGNGGGLTNLNAAALAAGTVPAARLGTNAASSGQILTASGDTTRWMSPGAQPPLNYTDGQVALTNLTLLRLTTNTITDLHVGSPSETGQIVFWDGTGMGAPMWGYSGGVILEGDLEVYNLYASDIYGSGANLESLNAGALVYGTVPQARLGTNAAQATDGMVLTKTGNQTRWESRLNLNRWVMEEEFISTSISGGQIGTHGWWANGTISRVFDDSPGRVGIVGCTTGTTSNNFAGVFLGYIDQIGMPVPVTNLTTYFWFRLLQTNGVWFTIGMANYPDTISSWRTPSGGAFCVVSNTLSQNFIFQLRSDSLTVTASTNSSVTVNTNWNHLKIVINRNTVSFSLNGEPPRILTGNHAAARLAPYMGIVTLTNQARAAWIDYWGVIYENTGRPVYP